MTQNLNEKRYSENENGVPEDQQVVDSSKYYHMLSCK